MSKIHEYFFSPTLRQIWRYIYHQPLGLVNGRGKVTVPWFQGRELLNQQLAIADHYCPVVLIGKRSKCIERNAKRTKLIVADLKISHL
jgi:hypothetical protein